MRIAEISPIDPIAPEVPTLTASRPWGHVERPWGYEVRVDFTAPDGAIHNEVLTFPSALTAPALDAAVEGRRRNVETRLAVTPAIVVEPERALRETIDALTTQVQTLTAENVRLSALLVKPAVIVG